MSDSKNRSRAGNHDAGLTRREVLRIGGLSALGLGLASFFRMQTASALPALHAPRKVAKSCILLWLDGGPSHIDTFDPKPDAPQEIRGPFGSIKTSVPGLHLCEHLPKTAAIAKHLSVVRSMTSHLGEHSFGSHYMLTGQAPTPTLLYPSLGSVVASRKSSADGQVLPPYVAVGNPPNARAGAGYLPGRFDPFVLGGDPASPDFEVRDLDLYPRVTQKRLARRQEFLAALDRFSRKTEELAADADVDSEFEQAYRLVTSAGARDAFDLKRESNKTRARYGPRTIGQSCLIARRLVERGVPFVTVTDRGWDTHGELYKTLKEGHTGGLVGKVPMLDLALSGLIEDLRERGMFDETLVVVMGEFGRTPKMNTEGGRDHWPRAFSALLAGACVPGGQVIGASDAVGENPIERPVTPPDLARTIFTILGLDPDHEFRTSDGRPVRINKGGALVRELLG